MALMLPAEEGPASDLEMARAPEAVVGLDTSGAQGGQADDGLEGGAGRIRPRDRVVELGKVHDGALDLFGIGGQERVRIEIRLGADREDLAGARVHRDGRPPSRRGRAQGVVGRFLHGRVDGEVDVAPGLPGEPLQHALQAPLGVDFHADAAVAAGQLRLEGLLEARLADARVGAIALGLELAPLLRAHLAHVAEEVAGETSERVVAPRLDDEVDAGVDGLELRELEHRLRREVLGETDGGLLPRRLLEGLEELGRVAPQLTGQLAGQGLEVLADVPLAGQEDEGERGLAGDQRDPRMVVDAAARGGLVDDLGAVALRGQPVFRHVEDLKLDHAQAEDEARGRDHPPQELQTLARARDLAQRSPQTSQHRLAADAASAFRKGVNSAGTQPTQKKA